MKRNFLKLIILQMFMGLFQLTAAQAHEQSFDIALWPNGLPNSNGLDKATAEDAKKYCEPEMRAFLPEASKTSGRAVLMCPGGGYHGLAMQHEGYDWAPFFEEQGIALFVLRYRMPTGGHKEVPFSDVEQAMRIIKENAAQWNINPDSIGIMGFSAGGHLASTYATKAPADLRPAFQILFYPVITMDKSYTHMGSHDNLLGKDASEDLERLYSNELQVDSLTPPAFITHSNDDKGVPSLNSVNYYLGLQKIKIPATLMIYPTGGHGWGYRDRFPHKKQMVFELQSWLKSL